MRTRLSTPSRVWGERLSSGFSICMTNVVPLFISLVKKAMKKAHRPVWRPVGPMAVPTFSNKLPLAMKRGRNRRAGTSSSSTAGSRVLKLAVHAKEEGSVSGEEDGELSDGNDSDVAIEDNGPILPLNDLLL